MPRFRLRRVLVFAVLASALCARVAPAQPFTLDEKIKPAALTLLPYRGGRDGRADGRVYGAEITQTESTQYFYVSNVSIYSPDYVGITAADSSSPITIALHKNNWDQTTMQGATDGSGHWDTKFRTNGDFGIKITSAHVPVTYALVVWIGNEVRAPMPSPFALRTPSAIAATPAGSVHPAAGGDVAVRPGPRPDDAPSSSDHALLYAVTAIVIVAILAFTVYKVKTARMCLLAACLGFAPPFVRASRAQDYPKAVGDMLEQLKSFLERQENVEDFWNALKSLSSDEAVPDASQAGPQIPSSCIDTSWKMPAGSDAARNCRCMADAVEKLRANRQMLERLRIIVANQKNFVDKAIALGNSYAQLHTMLGLQWIGIRKHDIEEPYAQFKQISNQKHQALMAAIRKDLQDISTCEANMGDPNWYDKFGFMYYEFLYSAYKPAF